MRKMDTQTNLKKSVSTLINAVKLNDETVLKTLYQENYPKIENLILQNNGSRDHAKDIFQEAFITVWKNVKQDKFTPQNESSLNGYLYTIAKNKWMDHLRSKDYKKTFRSLKEERIEASDGFLEKINDDKLKEERLKIGMQAFSDLADSCKVLLTKFYFEKKSMKTIAAELELDAASTRNKKYRCMQKLRELALKTS